MPVPYATPRPPCKVQEIVSRERTKCETARWWKGVQQKHKYTHVHALTSIQTHIGFSTNTNVLTPSSILSQVVPRAVSFRSNPVMSGKILPKSQKPRKTHFRTHNILAFRSPSPGKDEKELDEVRIERLKKW